MLFKSLAATTLLAVSAVSAADLPTIDVVGNKFFYSNNGSQFYIKGVAYQEDVSNSTDSSFTDPLLDSSTCKRDIPYLQELGTNVVRVYAVNASLNHDDCMQALNDAGIYVILDLAEPTDAIDTTDPSWTVGLYNRYTEVIDMFQDYPNVLGFFAGNEVVTNTSTSNAAPYVKALIRDMKQYMSDQGYRLIPIGYSANDESKTRVFSADYFACGDDDVSADFYGINMYEWCGTSSFTSSGYKARTQEFANLSVPVFFSEYGCNTVQPRKFTEVEALYGDDMTDVWSGGIVYMYFQTSNDYGLVSIDGDSVKTLSDFNYLKSQLASISPSSASSALVSATATTLSCPATNAAWEAATSLPPTPDQDLCDCAELAFGCVVDSSVDSDDYADLFSYVCNEIDCSEINGNGTTGEYGDYSFCSSKVKLNYVLNKYYEKEDSSSACDFDGSATINKKATTAASCSSILKGASASGSTTKHHKTTATSSGSDSSATDSSSDASSSGSGSDSSSAASSSSAKSGASSLYSRKYTSSFSELTMTVLFSTTVMVGAVVLAL